MKLRTSDRSIFLSQRMIMKSLRVLLPIVAVGFLLVLPELLHAQAAGQPGRQMRHFWHVFAAYAVAWALLFGWAVAIARRIARVEDRLKG